MAFVLILIAAALVLFWLLPLGFAIAAAAVIGLLVAARLRDALHQGRLLLAARKKKDDADSVIQDMYRRDTMFYALWIGLTVGGATGHHHDGGYYGGDHGGGDFGGGFGDGGGGGDSGGF